MQVVRLKGGDPFVFGRGGEEALACYAAGIPFEVVPGISSAIAVPAYAGIPVTHRGLSTSVTIFTGHSLEKSQIPHLDYAALARSETLVMLMGVTHLPALLQALCAAGLDPQTPAACIEWGTVPQQRIIEGSAETLASLVKDAQIGSPALTILGKVVTLRQQGLQWYSPP